MKQIELVIAIIDEVKSTAARSKGQAEQRAPAGFGNVHHLYENLFSGWRRFDQIAITAIDRHDIPVPSDCQSERRVNRAPL